MTTYNTPTTTAIEPISVIRDIYINQMGLDPSMVVFDNQKWVMPKEGIFMIVGYLMPSETIAAGNFMDSSGTETDQVLMRHMIQTQILSLAPDNSARIRKEEALMALYSGYSIALQEQYQMSIPWIQSDISNASYLDGTAMLHRYVFNCSMTVLHGKKQAAPYFDSFTVSLLAGTPSGAQEINIDVETNPLGGA